MKCEKQFESSKIQPFLVTLSINSLREMYKIPPQIIVILQSNWVVTMSNWHTLQANPSLIRFPLYCRCRSRYGFFLPDINFTKLSILFAINLSRYLCRSATRTSQPFFFHSSRFHFYFSNWYAALFYYANRVIILLSIKEKRKIQEKACNERIGMRAHAPSTRPPDSCDFLLIFDAIRIKKEFHKICEYYVLALA